MPRYRCLVEYDGSAFSGWQRQPNARTVQGVLEEAYWRFCRERVDVVASGRTDAGVHALGQVVHLGSAVSHIPYRLIHAMNEHCRPHPVAIHACDIVPDTFHARFSAIQRHYRYHIVNQYSSAILQRGRAWQVRKKLDIEAMRHAAVLLEGHHDFSSFRHSGCQASSPKKTIDTIRIDTGPLTTGGVEIHVSVSARSFLYHMVRNIVGTLVDVGKGRTAVADIHTILDAKDRSAAGPTAPADGLYFIRADYPPIEARIICS